MMLRHLHIIIYISLVLPLLRAQTAGISRLTTVRVEAERLPDLNVPRDGHAVLCIDGVLTVFGGHTSGFVPTATAEYLSEGQWHLLTMTYTHDDATVLPLSTGCVLLAGGHKENLGVGQTFEAELYVPDSHTFTGFGCMERARALASAIETDSGRVLITGNWYAGDDMECFDGSRFFKAVKEVSQPRVKPYLLRTSDGDVMVVGERDNYYAHFDSVVVDRLHGSPFTVHLLRQWQPFTRLAPSLNDDAFIGKGADGCYRYLLAATGFDRAAPEAERQGRAAGPMGIVLVEDTVFSLLPTAEPIPTETLGHGPIYYNCPLLCDRRARRAYLFGIDADNSLYIVSIAYDERPAPLTLYVTDPLPDCGMTLPALTDNGDLVIVGGSMHATFDADYFTPTASAWLIPLGEHSSSTATAATRWPWLLLAGGAAVLGLLLFWLRHKRVGRQPVAEISQAGDGSEPQQPTNDADGLRQRISHLMDERQLYRNSELKAADVAAELATNSRYVTDCIKEWRGMTFTQFVNDYRVRYSQQLLIQHPDRQMIEIYTEAGFASERSFFRIFKDATGQTPREWLSQQQSRL